MSQTPPLSNPSQQINAPFRAKSAAVSATIILFVGIYYLVNMLGMLPSGENLPDGARSLIFTSALLVTVLEIVLQIVLFVGAGKVEAPSEQDNQVDRLSSRNAYWVLRVGAIAAVIVLFVKATVFVVGSIVLLSIFIAEVVRFGSQVFYYRHIA